MAEGVLAFGFLLVAIGTMVGIYLLVTEETADPTVVDRETAEREAKARGGHVETDRTGGRNR